jgi:hypothetical protein
VRSESPSSVEIRYLHAAPPAGDPGAALRARIVTSAQQNVDVVIDLGASEPEDELREAHWVDELLVLVNRRSVRVARIEAQRN